MRVDLSIDYNYNSTVMWIKGQSKTVVGYTIYAIIGTALEVAVLLIVLLWVLPLLDIYIPWWIIVILMVVELGVSWFTYVMGRRALSKQLASGPEAIVGSIGTVAAPFNPTGYVKVRGELWKASCKFKLEVGDQVVVTRIDGMKLVVVPSATDNRQSSD
jgi:membrane protein implicated in regulation of membrane protease activity